MQTIKEILDSIRQTSYTERDKGTRFEVLMQWWLRTDPRYANLFSIVWLWEEFPSKGDFGGKDLGIDLVAKTRDGEYWAIQCKCYAEDKVIEKGDVDSFLATSSKQFTDEVTMQSTTFSHRLWISTTNHWNANAEQTIRGQLPPVNRINLSDLEGSSVDWSKAGQVVGKEALKAEKKLMPHQKEAIEKAKEYYKDHDRGKLIMACGTGKTFTSLRLVEELTGGKGLVLFMVPSIALLGQGLNDWFADSQKPIEAVCICSDARASRKSSRSGNVEDADGVSITDLARPASTDPENIARQLLSYRNHEGLVVVFSTYQSIDAVSEAQKQIIELTENEYGVFDFIVCDEAHRTTGTQQWDGEQSNFTKIHSNYNVEGKKRLYMTATPRMYTDSAKIKATEKDILVWSMDDEDTYGEEFYRVNFSYAVENNILTDYKVLVLTVSEDLVPDNIKEKIEDAEVKELNYDDVGRLLGVINGLSKRIIGDGGITYDTDPRLMRRALAFTSKIGSIGEPGSSKNVAFTLPIISDLYNNNLSEEERQQVVTIKAKHVDGSMGALQRNDILQWLAEESNDPRECRVVSNVRCLSEGVDVPALDAVLFLSARNSAVDVVQSVGRVMRSFHKGMEDEKKYGYIIIPVVIPSGMKPEVALDDNQTFSVVWEILNALRAHDDHFDALVNSISLNKDRPKKVVVGSIPGQGKSGVGGSDDSEKTPGEETTGEGGGLLGQLELLFGDVAQNAIFAKLVEKVGNRVYWENWSREVGQIALKYQERITRLIEEEDSSFSKTFKNFLEALRQNLNPGIKQEEAVEMLSQHVITRPVFNALFADYEFVKNNSISISMQQMIDEVEKKAMDKDLEVLKRFYESVRTNVSKIDNLEGKQTIIKTLYEKFFKTTFPKTVDKLGTVYTPVECVDFIIRSVDYILKKDFNSSLSEENVHILDPFVGTGTFITRLLQTGVIKNEDMVRKYSEEIHCNEINLLAYYIADVNIESVFQEQCPQDKYLPYNGICLTDTFQLAEQNNGFYEFEFLKENSDAINEQRKTPIRVIIGNPPYSKGQKKANDNAQNQHYPNLEQRLADTYVASSNASNKNSLYNSYIKAYRWASDRIPQNEAGIIAFISPNSWIDGKTEVGIRICFEREFSDIYIFDLKGDGRTSGERCRREGEPVFAAHGGMGGSLQGVSINILVKKPNKNSNERANIHYYDIGDYLKRKEKFEIISNFRSIENITWTTITPNENHDWLNKRCNDFEELIPLFPERKFDLQAKSFFSTYSLALETGRDTQCYNSSLDVVKKNAKTQIDFYNEQREKLRNGVIEDVDYETKKISWSREVIRDINNNIPYDLNAVEYRDSMYRPFFRQNMLWYKKLFKCNFRIPDFYPTSDIENLTICVPGGGKKEFSCLITDVTPDHSLIGYSQCFPLYWYKEERAQQLSLFDDNNVHYSRFDGITNWILNEVRSRFSGAKSITKEDIFYYVYGFLHSKQYREKFSADLKKSLPRIPIVEDAKAFVYFIKAGRGLADLHLNYDKNLVGIEERVKDKYGVEVEYKKEKPQEDIATFYRIMDKMRFPSREDKSSINFNANITIKNIPAKAYEYVVNGKSAIEWLMERFAVKTDTDTLIKNDINDWGLEHGNPRYALDVLLSVIDVSMQTLKITEALPPLYTNLFTLTASGSEEQSTRSDTAAKKKEIPYRKVNVERGITIADDNTDVLSLSIKNEYFNRILNGKKKLEIREGNITSEKLYVTYEVDGKKYLKQTECPQEGDLNIIAKRFKYLKLNGGQYKGKRPFIKVEVKEINISRYVDSTGKTIRLPYNNGEAYFYPFLITYRLGDIVEKQLYETYTL